MMPSDKLKGYIEKRVIEIVPIAYNATDIQMKMFLTRLGVNSKAIITGDITQIDLPGKSVSGLIQAKEILNDIEGVGFVYFDKSDVVRHKLVKDIIDAYEKFHSNDKL
jgi:phosphate starvation-inducible PhoH-like protein